MTKVNAKIAKRYMVILRDSDRDSQTAPEQLSESARMSVETCRNRFGRRRQTWARPEARQGSIGTLGIPALRSGSGRRLRELLNSCRHCPSQASRRMTLRGSRSVIQELPSGDDLQVFVDRETATEVVAVSVWLLC